MGPRGVDQGGGPLVGTVLEAAYRLTRLIGQGGMGEVYEGLQLRLHRRVAVKVMSRDLTANVEALARFRREAEVTSQLGHPNIVQVTDFGTAPSGEPYLVMEFLAGEDLEHRIRRVGRLPLASVLAIVKQIASALAATHARSIVHRDLKPANIFLVRLGDGEQDFVKVLDFGISKVRTASTKLTQSFLVMGTPHYMSPEQASGRIDDIDARTDEWALAAITYEMLEGRPPFVGEDAAALLYQVIHQDVPRLKAPGDTRRVEQILRRALSKRRNDRFSSVAEFARALELAAAQGVSVPVTPTRWTTSLGHLGPVRWFRTACVRAVERLRRARPVVPMDDGGSVETALGRPGAHPETVGLDDATRIDLGGPAFLEHQRKPTTFSHTTGEMTRLTQIGGSRVKRMLVAAAVGGTILLIGAAVVRLSHPRAIVHPAAPVSARTTPSVLPPTIQPLVAPPPRHEENPAPAPLDVVLPTQTRPAGRRKTMELVDPFSPTEDPFADTDRADTSNPAFRKLVPIAPAVTPYPLHGPVLTNGDLMVQGGDHGECSDVGRAN